MFATPDELGDWWRGGKLHRTLKVDLNTVDAVGDYCQMTQPADKLTVSPYRAVVDVAQAVLQSAQKKERRMRCADLD